MPLHFAVDLHGFTKKIDVLLCSIIFLFKFQASSQSVNSIKSLWNGKIYSTEIKGSGSMQFIKAHYTMFIPDSLSSIKGILIHQHGCTMEGTGAPIASDVQYQAFAKKWGLALIGPDIYPHGNNCGGWCNPENGSEAALFQSLDSLALLSNHPELKTCPWLLWGHSGGAYWATKMLRKYPEKMIAVVCYSNAFDSSFSYPIAAAKVPVLFRHAGDGDVNASWAKCWQSAIDNFSNLRMINGFSSIVHNKNQTHIFSHIRNMSIPFFESVLAQRLPLIATDKLRDIDTTKAWLADTSLNLTTSNLYPISTTVNDRKAKSWLPDSLTALKYLEFINTGTIKDISAPPSPFSLITNSTGSNLEITWRANADIESGIGYFNFYKNGALIYRFPQSGFFQTYNTNGDNAMPDTAPDMRISLPLSL